MLNILHGLPNTESVKKLLEKLGDDLVLCWHIPDGWLARHLCVGEYDMEGNLKASVVFLDQDEIGQIKEVLYNPAVKPLTIKQMARLPLDDQYWNFWTSLDDAIARLRPAT